MSEITNLDTQIVARKIGITLTTEEAKIFLSRFSAAVNELQSQNWSLYFTTVSLMAGSTHICFTIDKREEKP